MYLLILGLLCALILLYGLWTNRQLETEQMTLSTPVDSQISDLTIVQVSDIHFRRLRVSHDKLLKAVTNQKPDLIVVTGDTIDRTEDLTTTRIKDFINQLADIAPTYVIEGNHEETCTDFNHWRQMMLESRAVLLENQVGEFTFNNQLIGIAGLKNEITDLPSEEKHKLKQYIDSLLLVHHPEFYNDYLENFHDTSIRLIFTGHTHGGQIRLPFIGGILGPDNTWFPKYSTGIYHQKDTTKIPLIVSRGLGNSRFPIRLNNKPHIVTVNYQKQIL